LKTDGWWREAFERGAFPLEHLEALPAWRTRTRQQVQAAYRLLGLKKGVQLLDVGCGTGRHSIPLAKKGIAVTGLDISAHYLKIAREKAGRALFTGRRKDMRNFLYKGQFDAAMCLYTTLGYFTNPADDVKVLRNVYRALKPGGRFLLELANGSFIMDLLDRQQRLGLDASRWHEEKGLYILERPRAVPRRSGVITEWTFLRGAQRRSFTSFVRMYSRAGLQKIFKEIGFRLLKDGGNLPLVKYQADSPRLVLLAQKPKS
jgi:ubiquinone/menaquinone biosynthesis C-methylase UbiE